MQNNNSMTIFFNKPSDTWPWDDGWNDSLPLGNGRLGARIYGGVEKERIHMNEDSVWHGGFKDRNNPDCYPNLEEIRSLLKQGRIKEAENLAVVSMTGIPECQRQYQTLGDIYIGFANHSGKYENYRKQLDISTAISTVEYTLNEVNYKREHFISAVDEVMVTRLTADSSGKISFRATLKRGSFLEKTSKYGDDTIILSAKCGSDGVELKYVLKAIPQGGSVKTIGDHIVVENADSVIILTTAATTFRYSHPQQTCLDWIDNASKMDYDTLKQRHTDDYKPYFERMSLNIGGTDTALELLPINERMARMKEGKADIGLICLYFQFGRYLLLCSSRPNTLPANLQGIWNDSFTPPWDSKYTVNINAEMNYWLAETCNLSECHLPLFEHIERMLENGRKTAKDMYNCRGFVCHHNTDIWGDTAPQDPYPSATYWPMGAAWLCLHIWEHYSFTLDKEFLKKYYHLLKESAIFFLDFLIEDDKGRLVTCPSVSPENTYILPNGEKGCLCMGPSMDSQILIALFKANIEAATILDVDKELSAQFTETLARLPKPEIGKHGQLMEWSEDYEEEEPGHRHISHLFALHPSNQITVAETPELAKAARVTLERRLSNGGGHTGWSRAWIINMWARLWDGEKAYHNVQELLRKSTVDSLLDNHPPFQIDGNFGGTAGIVEMLVQSHTDKIVLLPAIPKEWSEGSAKGIRVRGGGVIDFTWENGKVTSCKLYALAENNFTIKTPSNQKIKQIIINNTIKTNTESPISLKKDDCLKLIY